MLQPMHLVSERATPYFTAAEAKFIDPEELVGLDVIEVLKDAARPSDFDCIGDGVGAWAEVCPFVVRGPITAGGGDGDALRAVRGGSYARLDLFKTRAGQQEMSDRVGLAKARIRDAFNALGRGKLGTSQSQSCVWNVVGLGLNLDQWTALFRGRVRNECG